MTPPPVAGLASVSSKVSAAASASPPSAGGAAGAAVPVRPSARAPARVRSWSGKVVRLAQKMPVGPCIPVGIQL
jgi:hypothetical protein